LERTREVGVMKAIGAKNSDIMWIFLIESGLLGLVGGIIGAFLGLSMALLVSIIASNSLPGLNFAINPSWPLLAGAIAFSFFIGAIFGVLPALQASKLNPVEALRR
jgi:putative ABC transport system permease protein